MKQIVSRDFRPFAGACLRAANGTGRQIPETRGRRRNIDRYFFCGFFLTLRAFGFVLLCGFLFAFGLTALRRVVFLWV